MVFRLYLSPGKMGANECNLGLVHQVPITAVYLEAVCSEKFDTSVHDWHKELHHILADIPVALGTHARNVWYD